jgi:putative nucleotidyltransferase with HDIG domain
VELENRLLSKFLDDINHNRIDLPTLPEVAMKERQIVESPDSSAAQIAITVGADPVMTTKLLQVANSALYRGNTAPIEDLQTAISRLGQSVVRNIVTGFAMEQLYQKNRDPKVAQHLKELWLHSTKVAAISHVLARKFSKLKPDHAMLAGLIHDIGVIPIYSEAPNIPELEDEALLQHIVNKIHNLVGTCILDAWNFPQELIDVVANHEDLEHDSGEGVDYVDIVTIANILSYVGSQHPITKKDWNEVPAFKKLGLTPEESIAAMEEAQEEVVLIQNMFMSQKSP